MNLRLMRWLPWLLALAAVGTCVLSEVSWRRKRAEREIRSVVESSSRYVDMGIVLRVVRMDLENGERLLDGKPPLVVLREHRLGGIVDTAASPPHFNGRSQEPVVWYCSEDQEPIVLHGEDPTAKPGKLVYGSEGAGKSVALAMWHAVQVIRHLGERREGGQTAPTEPRLAMVRNEMLKLYPPQWFRYKASEDLFTFCDGTAVRLVSTHQQSSKEGSRVQGYSWSWCGRDEMQDQEDAHEDIESRGRAAKDGYYPQVGTCTAKDHPSWRAFRDTLLSPKEIDGETLPCLWEKHTLLGRRSPFVWPRFWDAKRSSMSPREYTRRVEARDVGSELQQYYCWSHEESIITIPDIGPRDVTAEVLGGWGGNFQVLLGHDPGKLWHVTEVLKAYRFPKQRHHVWVVVDEISTEMRTIEAHVAAVLERLQTKWNCNHTDRKGRIEQGRAEAFVRADPYTDSGRDEKSPDKSVYTTFRAHGIRIAPAASRARVVPTGVVASVAQVPKEARINMMNRLLCAEDKTRRLFVLRGAAPKLIEAFESIERDSAGNAETMAKNKRDMTHWPAAVGYALWELEKPKISDGAGDREAQS